MKMDKNMTNDVVSKQANKFKWTQIPKNAQKIKVCHPGKSQQKQEFMIE